MALTGGLVERFCAALSAVRALIDSASPGAITSYASNVQTAATQLGNLLRQLRTSRADLERSWPRGEQGRDTTLNRMDRLIENLEATVAVLNRLVPLLNRSASTLSSCQRGFTLGVQTGSARIARILSSGQPAAQAEARLSAAQSTSALSGLISMFGRALEGLGVTGMTPLFDALGQVAGQIQQVSQQTSSGTGFPATSALTGSTMPGSPTGSTMPSPPLPTQQQLPAFTQYPWTGQQPATEANSWIPVSQPVPAAGGPGSGQVEVTVTTRAGDTATVRAVAGRDAAFDLTVGSEDVRIAIDGDGDGRVTTPAT
jgi:hypothetical protein